MALKELADVWWLRRRDVRQKLMSRVKRHASRDLVGGAKKMSSSVCKVRLPDGKEVTESVLNLCPAGVCRLHDRVLISSSVKNELGDLRAGVNVGMTVIGADSESLQYSGNMLLDPIVAEDSATDDSGSTFLVTNASSTEVFKDCGVSSSAPSSIWERQITP
ncbi:hypothetical protein FOZ60_015071 [Perkinsus olseni]|uniref:Uncharacterized protein n=1 Tax=Perkinsus olseni TaxID=32597 RepID=A0A7J6N670_PEROL|nr:hypothetical protein FOZ60_015071 [Perkinsus olseni]